MNDLPPVVREISKSRNWTNIHMIKKGWSEDLKFALYNLLWWFHDSHSFLVQESVTTISYLNNTAHLPSNP